jgi:hypothetical protein
VNAPLPPIKPPARKPGSGLFWIALFAPTVLALISMLCASRGPNDFGATVGLIGFGAGLISSVYCGVWLAQRFAKPGAVRFFCGLVAVAVIGIVNLIVVVAGCSGNVSFH